jgi:hypothetical protein
VTVGVARPLSLHVFGANVLRLQTSSMRVVTLGICGSGEVYLTAEQIFAVCEQ